MLENALQDRDKGLDRISQRLDILEKESAETKTILHMKDIVIDRLRLEVTKLQQFTRRYSVSISGIPKRDKKESLPADFGDAWKGNCGLSHDIGKLQYSNYNR